MIDDYTESVDKIKKLCDAKIKEIGLSDDPAYKRSLLREYKDLDDWYKHDNVKMADKILRKIEESKSPSKTNKSGSLILFLSGLSSLDPIKNEVRKKVTQLVAGDCPDIDSDFPKEVRDWVKEYVVKEFGEKSTCSIGNYQTMKTKVCIQDVARALRFDIHEVVNLTKQMDSLTKHGSDDEDDDEEQTIDQMDWEELGNFYPLIGVFLEDNPNLLEHCKVLRGQVKSQGKHAGGMIISDMNLYDFIPVRRDKKSGEVVSCWTEGLSAHELSVVGLVKVDILGITNLDIIRDTVMLIEKTTGEKLTKKDIQIDNKEAIRFGSQRDMVGIFQFESPATKPLADAVKMESLADLSAVTSLLRPGPKNMGMDMEYAERKNGKKYESIPCLEEILKETYGIIVYQESVMKMSQIVAGFTPIESNQLRGVISKKKLDQLPAMKKKFIDGAKSKIDSGELTKEQVEHIWNLANSFGNYGFNRSHAYTYSALSAAQFWLKFNYTTEYMTALLNNTAPNKKKHGSDVLIDYIKYSRSRDIKIKSPDINKSKDRFTIEGIIKSPDGSLSLPPSTRAIRFSLRHIKRVSNSSTFIVESSPYKSMDDFYERINRRKVNKGVMINLICSGSFDEFGRDIYIEDKAEEKREMYLSGAQKAAPNMSESKKAKVAIQLDKMKESWKRELSQEEISIDEIRNAAIVRYFQLRADKKDGEPPIKNEKEWHQLEIDVMGICLSREPIFEKYKEYMTEKKYLTNSKYNTNVAGIFLGRVEKVNSFKAKISQKNHFIISMTDDCSEITFYVWEGDRKSWTKKVKLGDIVAVPLKSFRDKETGEVDLSSKKFYDSRYNIDVVERNI